MDEVRAILNHFADSKLPITNDLLLEYCNLNKFTPISVGVYEDYKFAQGHDDRVDAVLPGILALFGEIRNVPELATDDERNAIVEANEAIQEKICFLFEEKGILYQDVDLITKGLGDLFKRAMEGVGRRINNASAKALMAAAIKLYGEPLTLKALGEATRGGEKGQTTVEAKADTLPGDEEASAAE